MATVETVYLGQLRAEATHLQSGTKIVTDAPVDNHGKGENMKKLLSLSILVIMLFASCSGSTGGGVKMIRLLIFVKQAVLCLHTLLRPRDYLPLRLGKHTISSSLAANVSAFFALHITVVFVSTSLIMFSGVNLTEALSTVIACIANTGPGLGSVGPAGNYAACNPIHLWVGSFCMFVGRLELFTVFVIFTRSFWRS